MEIMENTNTQSTNMRAATKAQYFMEMEGDLVRTLLSQGAFFSAVAPASKEVAQRYDTLELIGIAERLMTRDKKSESGAQGYSFGGNAHEVAPKGEPLLGVKGLVAHYRKKGYEVKVEDARDMDGSVISGLKAVLIRKA